MIQCAVVDLHFNLTSLIELDEPLDWIIKLCSSERKTKPFVYSHNPIISQLRTDKIKPHILYIYLFDILYIYTLYIYFTAIFKKEA